MQNRIADWSSGNPPTEARRRGDPAWEHHDQRSGNLSAAGSQEGGLVNTAAQFVGNHPRIVLGAGFVLGAMVGWLIKRRS